MWRNVKPYFDNGFYDSLFQDQYLINYMDSLKFYYIVCFLLEDERKSLPGWIWVRSVENPRAKSGYDPPHWKKHKRKMSLNSQGILNGHNHMNNLKKKNKFTFYLSSSSNVWQLTFYYGLFAFW